MVPRRILLQFLGGLCLLGLPLPVFLLQFLFLLLQILIMLLGLRVLFLTFADHEL